MEAWNRQAPLWLWHFRTRVSPTLSMTRMQMKLCRLGALAIVATLGACTGLTVSEPDPPVFEASSV